MAPSARTSTLRSVNTWLDQRHPWQYALIMACAVGASATVTVIIIGWLLRGHLNPSAILGTTAGTMIGCFIVALGIRLTRPRHH